MFGFCVIFYIVLFIGAIKKGTEMAKWGEMQELVNLLIQGVELGPRERLLQFFYYHVKERVHREIPDTVIPLDYEINGNFPDALMAMKELFNVQ